MANWITNIHNTVPTIFLVNSNELWITTQYLREAEQLGEITIILENNSSPRA